MVRTTLTGSLLAFSMACRPSSSATADAATSGSTGDETGSGATTSSSSTAEGSQTAASSSDGTTGSTGSTTTDEGSSTTSEGSEPGPDLRAPGPYSVQTQSGQEALSTGCDMAFTRWSPAGVGDAPVVILAHGFQNDQTSMADWAEHWASWGVTVYTPDLCHSTLIDAQHAQNGFDMVALVEALDLAPVVWAGHSAGGRSAVVAAAADPASLGVLGLDTADRDQVGIDAAPGVMGPGYLIAGQVDECNSGGNGVGMFAAMPEHRIVRLREADHCDFQSPPDPLCAGLCDRPNVDVTPAEIEAAILGLSTGFVLWRTGLDPSGQQWWQDGGPYYDGLVAAGLLESIL